MLAVVKPMDMADLCHLSLTFLELLCAIIHLIICDTSCLFWSFCAHCDVKESIYKVNEYLCAFQKLNQIMYDLLATL